MSVDLVIAIAGPSGSGKTLFTENLVNALEAQQDKITVLREDNYYRKQDHLAMDVRERTNYDHPDAFEHELLEQHLGQLRQGHSIDYPAYCYKTHTRLSDTTSIQPRSIVIIEGILLFSCERLRSQFDIKLYVDTPLDICLLRRVKRDSLTRGRSIESVLNQYEQTVRPMFHEFIAPSRKFADMVVTNGGDNPVALSVIQSHLETQLS
jgi:uridine kinase